MDYKYLFLLPILCSVFPVAAQNNVTLFFEPEIEFQYHVTSKYTHKFGVENRNFFYRDTEYNYEIQHLEFAHTSAYKLNDEQTIAMGVQYRFKENFETSEENEFRLIQRFEWKPKEPHTKLKQEIRTEQRFYASTTKFRLRYELGFTFPLNRNNRTTDNVENNLTYIKAETESLFEIAKTQKPEFEQRISSAFGWQLNPKSSFELGLQYRLADYSQNLGHELFLIAGMEVKL